MEHAGEEANIAYEIMLCSYSTEPIFVEVGHQTYYLTTMFMVDKALLEKISQHIHFVRKESMHKKIHQCT